MSIPSTIHTYRTIDGLAIIGRTKHALMGIRYEEGEGGDTAAAATAAAQALATKAAADAAALADKAPWTKENFDPERAQRLVENLRGDVEKQRIKFETDLAAATTAAGEKAAKDALAGIAKLLSGAEEPETDPVKLAAKVTDLSTQIAEKDGNLTKAQAEVKAANLSREVAIIAGQLGANPRLLLSNEDFKTSIASVEPTDEAAIQAKITAALQANPALKATPPRSGSDGHQGGQVADLRTQLAAAEKANDRSTVISLKRRIAALASS